jgi:hypothetical protein
MKYWKTTITLEILTAGDGPPDYLSVDSAVYDMNFGEASGVWSQKNVQLDEDVMRDELRKQGSDPEFLIPPKEDDE